MILMDREALFISKSAGLFKRIIQVQLSVSPFSVGKRHIWRTYGTQNQKALDLVRINSGISELIYDPFHEQRRGAGGNACGYAGTGTNCITPAGQRPHHIDAGCGQIRVELLISRVSSAGTKGNAVIGAVIIGDHECADGVAWICQCIVGVRI